METWPEKELWKSLEGTLASLQIFGVSLSIRTVVPQSTFLYPDCENSRVASLLICSTPLPLDLMQAGKCHQCPAHIPLFLPLQCSLVLFKS